MLLCLPFVVDTRPTGCTVRSIPLKIFRHRFADHSWFMLYITGGMFWGGPLARVEAASGCQEAALGNIGDCAKLCSDYKGCLARLGPTKSAQLLLAPSTGLDYVPHLPTP